MKKLLLFAAVFATALVSCSSDDETLSEPSETIVPSAMKKVSNISVKAAGTTMTISSDAPSSRAIEGNGAVVKDDELVVTLAPVVNTAEYTCAASGFSLKCNPWHVVDGLKKSVFGYNIEADITEKNTNMDYVAVNGNNISIKVSELDKLFNGDYNSYFQDQKDAPVTIPEDAKIDEWTYDVYLYPQVVSEELDKATGMPVDIKNPLVDINNEDNDWANLIGGKPFTWRNGGSKVKDRWGNTYTVEGYNEATPLVVETDKYNVRVMAYQGVRSGRSVNAGDSDEYKLGYDYEYNYGYIKVSLHIQKKK